jgi:O-antigen ligase
MIPGQARHRSDVAFRAVARKAAHKIKIPAPSGLVRLVFVLFIFSVPFEAIDVLFTGNTFSVSRLIGMLVICVALTQANICFTPPPPSFWLFAAYLSIATLVGLSGPSVYWSLGRGALVTLLQLLVLFWIAGNLLRYPRLARSTIATLAIATLIVAILNAAGIGRDEIPGTGRVSMFGDDPNSVAGMLSLGILAWIGLGRELKRRAVTGSKYWPVACIALVVAVIRTGSRGGVVALMAGMLALLLQKREGKTRSRSRWSAVIGVALAIVVGLLTSTTGKSRWEATLTEGSAAGREEIFPAAWALFLERPVLGWGPARNVAELGARMGSVSRGGGPGSRDTHNGLLWVLTEVGLVGTIPYVIGLWLCLRAAWRGRDRMYGVLPLALVICVLVMNMSVTWQTRKFYWLILALGVASSRVIEPRRPRRSGASISATGSLTPVRRVG